MIYFLMRLLKQSEKSGKNCVSSELQFCGKPQHVLSSLYAFHSSTVKTLNFISVVI